MLSITVNCDFVYLYYFLKLICIIYIAHNICKQKQFKIKLSVKSVLNE